MLIECIHLKLLLTLLALFINIRIVAKLKKQNLDSKFKEIVYTDKDDKVSPDPHFQQSLCSSWGIWCGAEEKWSSLSFFCSTGQ